MRLTTNGVYDNVEDIARDNEVIMAWPWRNTEIGGIA